MKSSILSSDVFKVDFSKVRLDNPGAWPFLLKGIACLVIVVAALVAGYYGIVADKVVELNVATTQEDELKKDFEAKAFQAKNIDALRKQMEIATETLGALLKQLPSDTEVPGLLEDVTKTGVQSGLTFDEIKLQPEKTSEFYVELPISITVNGSYHELATFISGVSSLPRIVTLHDFTLSPQASSSLLSMTLVAKTYRYNADQDTSAGVAGKKETANAAENKKSSGGSKP